MTTGAVLALLLSAIPAAARHHATGVESGPSAMPPAVPVVTFTPAPGVSIGLPQNWNACDADTQSRLKPDDDDLHVGAAFCGASQDAAARIRAFDPRPFHNLGLIFIYQRDQPMSEKVLAGLTPDVLDKLSDGLCAAEFEPLQKNGLAQDGCHIGIGALAGHRALVSMLIATSQKNAGFKTVIVSYELPYAGGYLQVQFSYAEVIAGLVKPELDQIVASIMIDAAASAPESDAPPADGDGENPRSAPDHKDAPAAPSAPEAKPVPDNAI